MTKETFKTSRSQPESESQSEAEASSLIGDGSNSIASLVVPDLEMGDIDPDAPQEVDENGEVIPSEEYEPDALDKDAFYLVFQTAFDMPSMFVKELKPLAIQEDEQRPARAASDAVYSLLEIYYPAALVPNSPVLAHLMAAFPFFFAKAMIVRELIRAKRAKPINEVAPQPEPETRRPASDIIPEKANGMEWMQ